MTRQEALDKIKQFPDAPGVYFFRRGKGEKGREGSEILYIGKATSLCDRVRSYFASDIATTRGPLIVKMLSEFDDITFEQTDSVLEALILEAYLIKKHQPIANIKEKDNKSFNFVVITDEDFPRILVIRGRELLHAGETSPLQKGKAWENEIQKVPMSEVRIKQSFGPFPNGSQLKEALKIIRKLFPYRDKCEPMQGKPCFNSQIGLCPGVCTGKISKEEYSQQIKNIVLFFEGKKGILIKNLTKEMNHLAKGKRFEDAQKIKRTLFALTHIQDISLIKKDLFIAADNELKQGVFRIESYDIAHLSGTNVVGVMTVVEDGEIKKSDYRKFKIKDNPGVNDTKALSEILSRRLTHIEWPLPSLIAVDGGSAQKNAIEKVLRQSHADIPVVSIVKDERHRPREILGNKKWLVYEREILLSNSEAHRFAIGYHKKLRRKIR
ncbi:MAG: GIY-YIG nuclease family protein [Patescibacteria group bacterium]